MRASLSLTALLSTCLTRSSLLQYGCGYQAVINTAVWGVTWGIATFFVYLTLYKDANNTAYQIEMVWSSMLLLFYGTLWLAPETKLFRRSAVMYYARFWTLIRVAILTTTASAHFGPGALVLAGDCVYDLAVLPLFIVLKPFVLYQSLLIDSQWWQGLESMTATSSSPARPRQRHTWYSWLVHLTGYESLQQDDLGADRDSDDLEAVRSKMHEPAARSAYAAIRGPLLGVEVGYSEAQGLAREVDTMRAQGTIKLLNFAYLRVNQSAKLGAGSFSTVYLGSYKAKPVAIKMLVTLDLNPDVIRRCNNEARILTEVSPNNNVVTIYGLAVLPPSVCLVLEICEFGSLSDVLRGCNVSGHYRAALRLTLADRFFLALGCARGLHALHSYSPTLCHRDIKSFNFLIDSQLNAKIADLDLGDDLPAGDGFAMAHVAANSARSGVYDRAQSSNSVPDGGHKRMANYSGTNMTWQAPEVLLGMAYTQRCDIYSLGLVFWEIIAAGRTKKKFTSAKGGTAFDEAYESVPFADCRNQQEIREKIVRGVRPSHAGYAAGPRAKGLITNCYVTNGTVDGRFVDTVRACWSADPSARPSLVDILHTMEACYTDTMHNHISETPFVVNTDIIHAEHLRLSFIQRGNPYSHQPTPTPYSSSGESCGNPHLSHHFLHTLSKEFITNLSLLKQEPQWAALDANNQLSYLILSPKAPFYVLYTNKRYLQTTGYVLLDLLAQPLDGLLGSNMPNNVSHLESGGGGGGGYSSSIFYNISSRDIAMRDLLLEKLRIVETAGVAEHVMANLSRRDGKDVLCSLHLFPIFEAADSPDAYYSAKADGRGNNLFDQGDDDESQSEASTNSRRHSAQDDEDVEEDDDEEDEREEGGDVFPRDLGLSMISDGADYLGASSSAALLAANSSANGSAVAKGSNSWTDSFMATLTKLPGSIITGSYKESPSIPLPSIISNSPSTMNLMAGNQQDSGRPAVSPRRARRKVAYIVVECSAIRG